MLSLTSKEQILIIGLILSLVLGVTVQHLREHSPVPSTPADLVKAAPR